MRLANLNVFIASLILAEAFLSAPFMLLVTIVAMPLGHFFKINQIWLFNIPYFLIFLGLILFALKYDLSPKERKTERESRYRIGHWLLAVTNIIVLIAVLTPFIMAKVYHNSELALYMWLALPVIGIAFFVWAGGLYMVRSSRA